MSGKNGKLPSVYIQYKRVPTIALFNRKNTIMKNI